MTMKEKLGAHLRRCRAIYIVGALALALINAFVFSLTRPSMPEEKLLRVLVLNVELVADNNAIIDEMQQLGYDIQEISMEYIPLNDNPYADMLLTTKLFVGNIDLIVADEVGLDKIIKSGACSDVSALTAYGLEPIECEVAADEENAEVQKMIGAMQKGEMYFVVPTNAAQADCAKAALAAVAEHVI